MVTSKKTGNQMDRMRYQEEDIRAFSKIDETFVP
jgi:hypothetical protein